MLAALGGYAYCNLLPVPYERVLASADADSAAIDAAYRGLRRFPGFAARADRLLADALRRRSGSATNVTALVNADTQLRALPGQSELADRLLAEFWLRKVTAAVDAEQRDAALLFALRAAARSGDAASARAWVGELADEDYRRLERTVRCRRRRRNGASIGKSRGAVALARERHRPDAARGRCRAAVPSTPRLSALRHAALERELRVEGEGSAGQFELSVALAHPASSELALTLAAPSGAQATLLLPQSDAASSESYVFAAQEGTPLAALADEERRGTWRLTLVDRRVDNSGTLGGWGLRFGEEGWRDDPAEGVSIPDPERTEAVTLTFGADDAFAIVQPAERGAIGSVALWDLAPGRLAGDFAPPLPPQSRRDQRRRHALADLRRERRDAVERRRRNAGRAARDADGVRAAAGILERRRLRRDRRARRGFAAAVQPAARGRRLAARERRRHRRHRALVVRARRALFRVARAEQRAAHRRCAQRQGAPAPAACARGRARACRCRTARR